MTFHTSIRFSALAALLFTSSACVNISSMQTAQTLEQGQIRIQAGGGVYPVPLLDAEEGDAVKSAAAPAVEAKVRYGLIENLDLGATITLPGTGAFDGKYRFLRQDNGLALATGLSIGTVSYSLGSGSSEIKGRFIDTMIPLYASYDVSSFFSVYAVPKYMLRTRIESLNDTTEVALGHFVGSSAGLKVGQNAGVFLEGSYLKGISQGDLLQGALAIFVDF